MKNGGPVLWNAIAIYETFKISWQMGRHFMKDDSENHLMARIYRSVQWLNIIRFLQKASQGSLHFGEKVLPGIFLGYELVAGGIWKGDVMIADIEELGTLDVSEIHFRRLNAKGVLTSMEGEIFIYPIATGTAKLCGRDHEVQESTQRQDQRVMSQDLREELQGNSERCQPTESQDDAEARDDFLSIKGDFIYRHHIEPRVQLYVPKEESFPIPLKYIDGTRTTHTSPDVLQEKRVNNCWNVDGSNFVRLVDWIHEVHDIEWETCSRIFVVRGGALQSVKQLPDPIICGLRFGSACQKAAKKKEKQEWAIQKPKLDNTRKLRGICFIDPEDGEFKEIGSSCGIGCAL